MYTLNMTQVIPVTEARKNLLTLVDEISDAYSRIDLTKNGKIKATLVSPDYLDSLEETIYSLKNSFSDIKRAEKELEEGKYISLEEIKKKYNAV
jgi:prevent-host-death family protein